MRELRSEPRAVLAAGKAERVKLRFGETHLIFRCSIVGKRCEQLLKHVRIDSLDAEIAFL